MSSRSDVKIWTRSLRASHPELVLVGRNLVLSPVRNVIRGIYLDRTSNKDISRAVCYLTPLIDFADPGIHFSLSHWLTLPPSNQPHFQDTLTEVCERAIEDQLAGTESVPDLLSELSRDTWTFDSSDITRHPLQYAVLLAAGGHLAMAEAMLESGLQEERRICDIHLAYGEREFARRTDSASGREYVQHASRRLERVARLEPLLRLIRTGDRAGIGALLHERERQEVKVWGVEHLWQPLPYPVESLS